MGLLMIVLMDMVPPFQVKNFSMWGLRNEMFIEFICDRICADILPFVCVFGGIILVIMFFGSQIFV